MFLWPTYAYGPVRSRRLGTSLGLNLLPADKKFCNFDCPYCECGLTPPGGGRGHLPTVEELTGELRTKLLELRDAGEPLHSITMAGNGEPTLHPKFAEIVDAVRALRDELAPKARVVVLSNGTRLENREVFEALKRVDERQLKLDAGTEKTFRLIDAPLGAFTLVDLVRGLKRFGGDLVIQTILTRGTVKGQPVDNTTPDEVAAYVQLLREVRPSRVALYSLDREAPEPGLVKLTRGEMERVAEAVRAIGIPADVY
ncbi:MAG: radical SAM protein [Planctomycetes bacterium]|nr:radical SAM protein [Planctomycetota bacterium]